MGVKKTAQFQKHEVFLYLHTKHILLMKQVLVLTFYKPFSKIQMDLIIQESFILATMWYEWR